ncbi:caspase domain-containing protein [Streptomyces sp. NPDC086023]|uniref:caspase domain-containing protein n=1 Tax=Streptomyces sp. NPDC086023 TaxID=3365746 RepID=UPI0037D09D4A
MSSLLPRPERSQAVLVGGSQYEFHPDIESVDRNLDALRRILTDPAYWGLPQENCHVIRNPERADDVMTVLETAAERATDALIFYFAGHGLSDEGGLYLALKNTRKPRFAARYDSVHYEWVRSAMLQGDSPATRRIVILDCCYSGQAADEQMGVVMGDENTDVHGTVVWAATTPTRLAVAPREATYTAFTGELVHTLHSGIEGGAEVLDMDTIFRRVSRSLVAKGYPQPDQHNRALGGQLALVRNRALAGPADGRDAGLPGTPVPALVRGRERAFAPFGSSASWEPFTWGPLQTDLLVVEGDGESVIPEDSVHVRTIDEDVELPEDLYAVRARIEAEQDAKRLAGEQYFWNGLNYAVDRVTIGRIAESEAPEIYIQLLNSDYYNFQATQQLDEVLPDGLTVRAKYVDPYDPLDVPAFMGSSFGTNVAVITRDEKLIVSRRSNMVGSHPGTWNSSANEALSRVVDNSARQAPNIFNVARRGLSEELALSPDEYRLNMLALTIDKGTHQWGALFMARLRRVTSDEFIARRSRGVSDKWEHDRHELVDFEIDPVTRFIFDEERTGLWSPTAPGLFYLALVNKYGKVAVERESARVLQRMRRA